MITFRSEDQIRTGPVVLASPDKPSGDGGMNQQRLAVSPAFGGTLFLIGWVAIAAWAVIPDGSASIEVAPSQASQKGDFALVRISFAHRFADWPSRSAALPEPETPAPAIQSATIAPSPPAPVETVEA